MIPNGEGWHYLAVKKSPELLTRITSKNHGDFYSLNCLQFFAKENKFASHKKVYEDKNFCNFLASSEDTKILEFNQYQKPDRAPFVIYADLECVIGKIDGCKNNPENSSTTKVGKHITSSFSMSTLSSFKSIENRYHVYPSKDFINKFF